MKRTVIFDLDGTLVDTSFDLLAAANATLEIMGFDARLDPEDRHDRATALRGGRAMLTRALDPLGKATAQTLDQGYPILLKAYAQDIARHSQLYPHAMEAVEALKAHGHPVGICTNKPEGLARQLLTALGILDAFDSLIGADTYPVRKPDPLPFIESVRQAGGDPAHACLIGDTQTDRDTGLNAQVPVVLVTFGPGGDGTGADMQALEPEALLRDFRDLPALVEQL